MLAIFNTQGERQGYIPERIFQGSNKANTIYFLCPLATTNTVNVAFGLSDGTTTARHIMMPVENGVGGIYTDDGSGINVWKYDIPVNVTKKVGNVTVQFYITCPNEETISTEGLTFTVEKGVMPEVAQETDAYTEVSNALVEISNDIDDIETTITTQAGTITGLSTRVGVVESAISGVSSGASFTNYRAMVTALNAATNADYKLGQSIYIETVNVPDVWVSKVEQTSSTYTYLSDSLLENAIKTNGYIQVGYYRLCALESQKPDLSAYLKKNNITYIDNNDGTVDLSIMAI